MKQLLLSFFLTSMLHGYELSITAIFQNEAPYLKEWIEYHLGVGVEHFWLYNNESEDDYLTPLLPFIENGIVDLYDWKNFPTAEKWGYSTQPAAYRDALEKSKGKTDWLAIIDLDEYLLPMQGRDVRSILKAYYSHAAAIYVSWLPFGTGGLSLGPGPILPYLTSCAKKKERECSIGKSIVRPEVVITIKEPHLCQLIPPFCYFNGDGEMKLDLQHHNKFLRINHYMFRDEWYFWNIKVPRYIKWKGSITDLQKLNRAFSKTNDYKILELLP